MDSSATIDEAIALVLARQPRCLRRRADGRSGAHCSRSGLLANALLLENPRSQSRLPCSSSSAPRTRTRRATQPKSSSSRVPQGLIKPVEFTSVAEAIDLAWHVREGLLGWLARIAPKVRRSSRRTSVSAGAFGAGAHDVQELLAKHGFFPVSRDTQLTEIFISPRPDLSGADGLSRTRLS